MKALISNDGTLMGFTDNDEAEGVRVPDGCDLLPGKYRWDKITERWEPVLTEFKRPQVKGDPDSLIAIALGFRALEQQGVKFHPYTVEWIRTFDRYPDLLKRGR